MTKLHIMLDLETWGMNPGSAIASIGAVAFDPHGVEPTVYGLYHNISRESCLGVGLKLDQRTVDWWAAPERAEARAALELQQVSLAEALADFSMLYKSYADVAAKADRLWSNGPSFDEAILGAAYPALGQEPPWRYNAGRDCRTIYDLHGLKLQHTVGTFHHALDDAREQALLVQEAYRRQRSTETFRPVDVAALQGIETAA